jgi:hypothetical protein
MALLEVTAVAIGLFALLQWLVMPRLRSALTQPRPNRPVRLIVAVILGNLIRSTSLIAAIAFSAIVVVLSALALTGHALPLSQLAAIFHALSELREKIEKIDTGWSLATVAVLSVALWFAVRRDATRQLSAAVDAAVERLRADAAAGRLQPLEPTPRMQQFIAHLAKLQDAINAPEGQARSDAEQTERLKKEANAVHEEIGRLDALRRLDIGANLSALTNPPRPANRFAAILVSAGVLQSLSLVSKAVATLSLALMAPALITLSGDQLAASIAHANVELHRLIVAESQAQAESDWFHAQPPAAQQRDVTAADQALIQQLSYHYQAFARLNAAAEYRVPANAFRLTSTDVRRELLANYAASHPTALEAHGGTPARKDEADLTAHASRTDLDGPEAARFRERMLHLAHATPQSQWETFSAKASSYLHAMARPVGPGDIGQRLFSEVLNMGGSITLDSGPNASALRELVGQIGKPGEIAEQAAELMDIDIVRFATGIREFGTPQRAMRDLPGEVPRHIGQTDEWAERLKDHVTALVARADADIARAPPTLDERMPPEPELRPALATARDMMAHAPDPSAAAHASDVVTTYRDLFPGVVGDDALTPRASLVREFPRVAEAVGQGAGRSAAEAMQGFVRARSYASLRGFAKIGGVLIGLSPHGGHAPSIVALDWTDALSGVSVALTRDDGKILRYGPFRAAIVRAALAYAADGRPIAATMPLAVIGRQVLLHPALIDTALGCETRLLDQFVDGATSDDPARLAAEQRVIDQLELYKLGWAVQFDALDRAGFESADERVNARLKNLRSLVPDVLDDQRMAASARRALAEPAAWANPDVSPVSSKPAFFDQTLVAEIGQCMRGDGAVGTFKSCVAAQSPKRSYIDSLAWLMYPPRLRPESGVRELEYPVTEDLDFLDLRRSRSEQLWPFDFMLQITFESPPVFDRSDESDFDKDPFEFPAIKPRIHQLVAQSIASPHFAEMDAARVLNDLREFTVLQRFFRLALAGDLGRSFPLDRLVELGKVQPHTAPAPVRTLRWNIFSPRQREQLVQAGFGPQLKPLGYERDVQQFLSDGPRCAMIQP